MPVLDRDAVNIGSVQAKRAQKSSILSILLWNVGQRRKKSHLHLSQL